jgi:hypothetical protein
MGIDLSGQSNLPDFVEEIVRAWGLAAINWGRMEQTLELLLVQVNSPEYKTSEDAGVPTTSFRLKVEKFERIFAKHPLMSAVHHIAKPVCIGLKKANKSRIPLTHCSVKNFDAGPPGTVQIQTIKRRGDLVYTSKGVWTARELTDLSVLLLQIWGDFQKIIHIIDTDDFRQSLRKELSRTQRALIRGRRLRSHWRRLCSRICAALKTERPVQGRCGS